MEWIEQNKEWFLSGMGIFLVSSIVSFASVLLTLIWKSRSENKKKKKLKVSINLMQFSVPLADNSIPHEYVKFSYKGIEYEHLCLYSVLVRNSSLSAISNQRLHFLIPMNAEIIEFFQEKSLNSINISQQECTGGEQREIIHIFDCLEPDDSCSLSYLLDLKDKELLRCMPRGVSNIEYIYSGDIERSEIEKLVYLIAIFIFSSAIPFLGSLVQGLVVLASTPLILKFYRKHFSNKSMPDSLITIHGGIMNEHGNLVITQRGTGAISTGDN